MGRHLVTPHKRVVAENRLQGSKTTARVLWYRHYLSFGAIIPATNYECPVRYGC
ncbi:MAG: hypothetical protein LBD53_06735 [Tannerella sp.]|nr:hypothetical protein [Tannerella sp.]